MAAHEFDEGHDVRTERRTLIDARFSSAVRGGYDHRPTLEKLDAIRIDCVETLLATSLATIRAWCRREGLEFTAADLESLGVYLRRRGVEPPASWGV